MPKLEIIVHGIPRQALYARQNVLGDRLDTIAELEGDDLASLLNVIDALVAKSRLHAIAGEQLMASGTSLSPGDRRSRAYLRRLISDGFSSTVDRSVSISA